MFAVKANISHMKEKDREELIPEMYELMLIRLFLDLYI